MQPKITVALVSALSLLSTSSALPSAEGNALQPRANPNNIMMFDCTDYKGRTLKDLCMSMCFGSFCAGNGQSLVWDNASDSIQRSRARDAGCRPTPNRCAKSPYGKNYQCDEFPFKSVKDTRGTRVNRCVPKKQNQDQAQIVKAFYGKNGYCKAKAPCSYTTGYENSGNIKYCNKKTCKNDGNEYTKGDKKFSKRDDDDQLVDELFSSGNATTISWPTRFKTAQGTEVNIAQGAQIGDIAHRMIIKDETAWDAYIEKLIAAEDAMTEDEYWQAQAAPADDELYSLIDIEQTTITEVLPDY
ncbi:hypothetical protein AMS68_001900 [Peltaster fructicola]|uniref:Deoxyribonuclease NucA/NucB domain-containing protein n=1 Tax=Peltaster fructicola TaxID=286661 RepID=A0A6H0XNU1_9PEZI|nr:hypothetical protein AMS68_001900 [Peltaster fructicola]